MDRLVGPFSLQAQLAPDADVPVRAARRGRIPFVAVPATVALRTEDAVELLEAELRNRIVLVDEHDQRKGPSRNVVRAGRHRDLDRQGVEDALIALELVPRRAPAHRRELGALGVEPGDADESAAEVVLEFDVRVVLVKTVLEGFLQHAVDEIIRPPLPDRSRHRLPGFVFRQRAQVELLGVIDFPGPLLEAFGARLLQLERIDRLPGRRRAARRVLRLGARLACGEQKERERDCRESAAHFAASSSFLSCARTTSALSGKYLPSRMTSAWPSWLSTKRRNSSTAGFIGLPDSRSVYAKMRS